MKQYICIDIGGTSIKHGVLTEALSIVEKGQQDTESHKGGVGIVEKIKGIISEYQKKYKVWGVAISTAGIVDTEKGEIRYSCDLIPNYTGTPIKQMVEDTFNLPCTVENDVNCAGIAESVTGAGRGRKSILCLTIGTGIGGCLVDEHGVYHGAFGSGCEVGYLRMGNGKTFQEMAAASVLVKKIAAQRGIQEIELDGKIIFEEAKAGAEDCIKAIDELVDALGDGIADCVYLFNPEMVILGGGIMAQREYLKPRIEKAMDEKIIETIRKDTTLAFAENGNDAGMIGALLNYKKIQ